jgi:hypothetical protein
LTSAASHLVDDPLLHFYLALWYEAAAMKESAERELKMVLALQPHPDLAVLVRSHLITLESSEPKSRSSSTEATDTKGE